MLTRKQLELLEFIDARLKRDGVPPSFDEMKEALNLRSKSGIHRLITALEERGFIRRLPTAPARSRWCACPRRCRKPPCAPRDRRRRPRPPPAAPRGAMPVEPPCAGTAGDGPHRRRHPDRGDLGSVAPCHGARLDAVGQRQHYALEVRGDSMIEAGINDGDIVVIREQTTADNGDIVVALVEGQEATLKRFRRRAA
jgi:repressor LexA